MYRYNDKTQHSMHTNCKTLAPPFIVHHASYAYYTGIISAAPQLQLAIASTGRVRINFGVFVCIYII